MTLDQKLRTVKDRVEFLLQKYPPTRNNDFYLTLLYLKYFDNIPLPYIEWDHIVKATTPETVSRCRRKIQNDENRFLPTDPKVRRQRKIAEEIYRQWAVQS